MFCSDYFFAYHWIIPGLAFRGLKTGTKCDIIAIYCFYVWVSDKCLDVHLWNYPTEYILLQQCTHLIGSWSQVCRYCLCPVTCHLFIVSQISFHYLLWLIFIHLRNKSLWNNKSSNKSESLARKTFFLHKQAILNVHLLRLVWRQWWIPCSTQHQIRFLIERLLHEKNPKNNLAGFDLWHFGFSNAFPIIILISYLLTIY